MAEELTTLRSIDRSLREMLKWNRFANISRLKEVLEAELDTDEKKVAYENSDGNNGLREVAAISGAPMQTIHSWWQSWFRLGIVNESETRKGRMEKIVSLVDVGIRLPKRATPKTAAEPEATQGVESSPAGTAEQGART